MRQKLIAKGFRYNQKEGYLVGEFNGVKVNVYIATNNNKVFRIMVCDVNTLDETNIRIRFNNLVRQFQNNKKYMCLKDYTIPEGEDVSYEMLIHNKRYEAVFYQEPNYGKVDTLAFRASIIQEMLTKYTEEQLSNPTEEIEKEYKTLSLDKAFEFMRKKSVWFIVSDLYGKYYITMFYDNEYNRANGEDL